MACTRREKAATLVQIGERPATQAPPHHECDPVRDELWECKPVQCGLQICLPHILGYVVGLGKLAPVLPMGLYDVFIASHAIGLYFRVTIDIVVVQ